MNAGRRRLFSMLTDLTIRLRTDRPDQQEVQRRIQRASFRSSTLGWPLRITGFLRDRLRSRWLRIRRLDDS